MYDNAGTIVNTTSVTNQADTTLAIEAAKAGVYEIRLSASDLFTSSVDTAVTNVRHKFKSQQCDVR